MCPTWDGRMLSGQLQHVASEDRDLILHDVPKNLIFEHVIPMSEDIAQPDNLVYVRHSLCEAWMIPSQPGQRFPNDLELAFHDELQCTIIPEITEGLAPAEGPYLVNSLENILAKLLRVMPHR